MVLHYLISGLRLVNGFSGYFWLVTVYKAIFHILLNDLKTVLLYVVFKMCTSYSPRKYYRIPLNI